MSIETMDLEETARYLKRDARDVARLADRGKLPGRKVGGEWRFSRTEITHWVETQLSGLTDDQLVKLEGAEAPIVGTLLTEECITVPLTARTKASVLRELVATAERSWQVYKPDAILEALKQREEMSSTALENGVAIPHPRRPLPNALGESIIAYGRTTAGIPFGGPHGALTDIYFLVCCRNDRTHLHSLTRISRLLLRPGLVDQLRGADSPGETYQLLEAAERDMVET